ncbi:hypothetical protein FRB96_007767 [Tulasnella sp. 330]|nr:hypothetical protein FRB96_007767 [Tulasnella sp. 330]KAG8875666.1 hypothetical protein FRB97_004827 [Tulasnella sp. 331]
MPSPLILLPFLSRKRAERRRDPQAQAPPVVGPPDLERAESAMGPIISTTHTHSGRNSRAASLHMTQLASPADQESSEAEDTGDEAPDRDRQGQPNATATDIDLNDDDHHHVRTQPMVRRNIEFHAETMDTVDNSYPRRPRPRARGSSISFRRFDSTTSSETSWHGNEHGEHGSFRRAIQKIKYFIFQNDPNNMDNEGTYLPILSGCLVPFAILLEIPGLTEHWYVRTEGDQVVDYHPNPPLLDAGMSISMACAVIANAALIARFLENKVRLTTLTCMFFLIIHDLINVTTVTVFGVVHRFSDGFTYGEAFWMIVCSTICSLTVTVSLVFDLVTTPDFAHSGSGLTRKQRSLIIMVMILISYIALGSLAFSLLLDLTFQDGLYFTVVTIETIGFGDIHPHGTASTVFTIFYATFGIINIGLVVNTTRETIIEAFQNAYRKRATEVARRRHENKVLRLQNRARRAAIERQLKDAGLPLYIRVGGHFTPHAGGGRGGAASAGPLAGAKWVLNEKALEKWQKEKAERERREILSSGRDPEEVSLNGVVGSEADAKKGRAFELVRELEKDVSLTTTSEVYGRVGPKKGSSVGLGDAHSLKRPTLDTFESMRESECSEESYIEFRKRIKKEENREFVTKLVVAISLFFMFWFIGAGIFVAAEKWEYGRSLYFCWMAFSTLGYGEITPVTPAGRAIFVVWALMGVAAMTILISVLSEAYGSRYQSALKNGSFAKAIKSFEGKQQRRLEVEHLENHEKEEQDGSNDVNTEDEAEEEVMDAIADEAAIENDNSSEKDAGGSLGLSSVPSSPMQMLARVRLQRQQSTVQTPMMTPARQLSRPGTPSPVKLATSILTDRRERLDSIPLDVIRHAKSFHEHVRYFAHHPNGSTSGQPGALGKEAPPREFHELLEEIAESERMDERMKKEMLSDDDARRALFFMSYDRAFKKLIDTAENAVKLIARKDAEWAHLIEVLKKRESDETSTADDERSKSGSSSARSVSPSPPGLNMPQTSSPQSINAELTPVGEKSELYPNSSTDGDGHADGIRHRNAQVRTASYDSSSTTRHGTN